MTAVETISMVLRSGVLSAGLTIVPGRGATIEELRDEERMLGRRLSAEHEAMLKRWNGIGLEVIRFFGCGSCTGEIGRLSDFQLSQRELVPGSIVVGSDASGFVYLESRSGGIMSYDTDGGGIEVLASGMDDLISRVVFGVDSATFLGKEWLAELRNAGVV